MADKNKNDIIEEQRRARREFLRLKQMQRGEIDAGPKPSEIAIVPKTPKEKWDNFWFQYKWFVITGTLVALVLIFLISQCVSRVEPDIQVVYFTYTQVLDNQLIPVEEYFEKYTEDINGDGQVKVQIVNCSISEKQNTQYATSVLSKIQAILTADEKTLLFITDAKSKKYFNQISDDVSIFEGEPVAFGDDFYKATENKDIGPLTKGLTLSIRRVTDTLLEKNKDVEKYLTESTRVLKEIEKDNSK